jgi:hypothetical protein
MPVKKYLYHMKPLFFQREGNIYLYGGKKRYSINSDDKKKDKLHAFAAKTGILRGMSFGL